MTSLIDQRDGTETILVNKGLAEIVSRQSPGGYRRVGRGYKVLRRHVEDLRDAAVRGGNKNTVTICDKALA